MAEASDYTVTVWPAGRGRWGWNWRLETDVLEKATGWTLTKDMALYAAQRALVADLRPRQEKERISGEALMKMGFR